MKTNKRKIKMLSAIGMVLLLTTGLFSGCKKGDAISLPDLKSGEEYEYVDAKWNASVDEVSKSLPYKIKQNFSRGPTGEVQLGETTMVSYDSEQSITVDGVEAVINFEFYDDELKMINFKIKETKEDIKEQFDKQAQRLLKQFGETEKQENSADGWDTTVYKWEGNNTALLFGTMSATLQNNSPGQLSLLHNSIYDINK